METEIQLIANRLSYIAKVWRGEIKVYPQPKIVKRKLRYVK